MSPGRNDHIFNTDLLIHPSDRKTAEELYPSFAHVLWDDELVRHFTEYSDRADAAKTRSRRCGKWAIMLGAIAIVLAAAEMASHAMQASISTWPLKLPDWSFVLWGMAAAVCGLISVGIGSLNVLSGARKRQWLHNRFMGERIRQFHFQSLIFRLPEIMASLPRDGDGPDQVTAKNFEFDSDRSRLFAQFRFDFEGNLDSKYASVIGEEGEADCWLCPRPQPAVLPPDDEPRLFRYFDAYRRLRILHQLDYANHKLQRDYNLFSPLPRRQAEVLEGVSVIGIAWLFLIHTAVLLVVASTFLFDLAQAAEIISIIFGFAIIVIAVAAITVRAFQQGLQPEREVERYQQYRSALRLILDQFDGAATPAEKINVMRAMERLSFEEMRNFLVTHERSSFAM
jgi:hypothetical protein